MSVPPGGRLSRFYGSNQSPLTAGGDDFIPLQHLVEGGANVDAAGSAITDSEENLEEVTVGTFSKVSSNMLQHFPHIHRKVSPVRDVVSWRRALTNRNTSNIESPCTKRRMA
jgi:hypothetical protein